MAARQKSQFPSRRHCQMSIRTNTGVTNAGDDNQYLHTPLQHGQTGLLVPRDDSPLTISDMNHASAYLYLPKAVTCESVMVRDTRGIMTSSHVELVCQQACHCKLPSAFEPYVTVFYNERKLYNIIDLAAASFTVPLIRTKRLDLRNGDSP